MHCGGICYREMNPDGSELSKLFVKLCLQKDILKFWLLVPQNITLFDNGVVGNIISKDERMLE